jgi:hypothetical protein
MQLRRFAIFVSSINYTAYANYLITSRLICNQFYTLSITDNSTTIAEDILPIVATTSIKFGNCAIILSEVRKQHFLLQLEKVSSLKYENINTIAFIPSHASCCIYFFTKMKLLNSVHPPLFAKLGLKMHNR